MELVYLWVRNYKNIRDEGFNFSPKFDCEYNEDTNELTINEKEHIKDFFGKNINVTAIVGENGSGKSSLQKIIFMILFFNKYKNLAIPSNDNSYLQMEKFTAKEYIKQYYRGKAYLIYSYQNDFYKLGIDDIDIIREEADSGILISISSNKFFKNTTTIDFFNIHLNYMMDTWVDNKTADKWVQTIYHRSDGYETPLLLEPYKGHEEQIIDIDNLEYLNIQKILKYYNSIQGYKIITDFFNPTKVLYKYGKNIIKDQNEYKLIIKFYNVELKTIIHNEVDNDKFIATINQLYADNNILTINRLYIVFKGLEIGNSQQLFKDTDYDNLKQTFENELLNFINIVNNINFNDFLLKQNYYKTAKIEQAILFNNATDIHAIFKSNLNQKIDINTITYFDLLPSWLYIDLYENNEKKNLLGHKIYKSYRSLSSGEKQIFTQIINILYQVHNIKSEDTKYKTINIFFDETEYGLHPNWQKKYINLLSNALKNENIKINLFFASHSPFLLSDLPKENVIFLEKGKQVYPEIETFGANIHTLLSHGFFMKDGLMGEFAKSKIEAVYNFIQNNDTNIIKTIQEAQEVIDIIGEPLLSKQLQNLLYEKFKVNSKDEEIEYLKQRIIDLENVE